MTESASETDPVHDALASYPVETTVRCRLHDIRPHEVWEVDVGGERAICKLGQHPEGDPALEARLLQFVGDQTAVSVPEILAVGDDHFIARWCPDLPENPTVDAPRLRAMGACMATLHADAADGFDAPGRPAVDDELELSVDTDERWSETLCSFLEDRRRFLAPRGYGDLAAEVREFVDEFRWAFDDVGEPTLLHGNVLPDHVGVDRSGEDTRASVLIDFEHAIVGAPVWDLLRSLGPLFGPPSAKPNDDGRAAFLDGYRSVRSLPENLDTQLRRHEVINTVSYIRSLHLQRGNRDDPHAVARRARGLAAHTRACMADLRSELQEQDAQRRPE